MSGIDDMVITAAIKTAEAIRTAGFDVESDYAQLLTAVDEYYAYIPCYHCAPTQAVRRAVVLKFLNNLDLGKMYLATLKYDDMNGCYYFNHAGMYHGVEPDGYIHT
jgi:hypothetical protein